MMEVEDVELIGLGLEKAALMGLRLAVEARSPRVGPVLGVGRQEVRQVPALARSCLKPRCATSRSIRCDM